jgi:hypothetical protein
MGRQKYRDGEMRCYHSLFALEKRTAAMGRVEEMVPWKSLVSLSWGPSVYGTTVKALATDIRQ